MTEWTPKSHSHVKVYCKFTLRKYDQKIDYPTDEEIVFEGIKETWLGATMNPRDAFGERVVQVVCKTHVEACEIAKSIHDYMNGLVDHGLILPNGWYLELHPTHEKDKV